MLTALLIFLAACATKVEYIEKPVAVEISFPEFPDLKNAVKNDNGTVTVPDEWIKALAEYRIRIEETEENYSRIKSLYSETKEEKP